MGYHPETLVCSFPPYPRGGFSLKGHPKSLTFARAFYRLKPIIGFDIWHIDPERRTEGQRRDDSCGWFDRRPHEYAEAEAELLADKSAIIALENAFRRSVHQQAGYSDRGWVRMTPADTLAACLMVASSLEHLRQWRLRRRGKWFVASRYDASIKIATSLALNETDNLQTSTDAEPFIRCIAAALSRHHRPWWRHPRWHVHHWRVTFDLARNLRRMRQRCATCGRRLGFNTVPTQSGGKLHHGECLARWHADLPQVDVEKAVFARGGSTWDAAQ